MQDLSNLKKGDNLHHFNIIESGSEKEVGQICEEILSFQTQANPNYFYQKYDTFLVDDARELIERQNRKHKSNESAVFAIECGSINIQAQNALLKIFEDSKSDNYFFLLISQVNVLLPTLLSRAVVYKNNSRQDIESVSDFPNLDELRKMTLKKRMDLVTKWMTEYKKEKIQKTDLNDFLHSIILELNQEILEGKTENAKKLKQISDISEFFNNNGAHIKSILEFAMLTI